MTSERGGVDTEHGTAGQQQQQGGLLTEGEADESSQGVGLGVFRPPLLASAPRGVAVAFVRGEKAVVLDLQEDEEEEDEEEEQGEEEEDGAMEDS